MLQHRSTIDVRFYELDPYNHVNHTNYLAYCEVARVRALESCGIGLNTLHDLGFHIVVIELEAKFLAPAVGGDTLDVFTEVVDIRRASMHWSHRIERDGETIFTLAVRAAVTDVDGSPLRVPDVISTALSS